jgi:hypothetical protein
MEPIQHSLGLAPTSAGQCVTLSFLPCLGGEFRRIPFHLGKIVRKSLSPGASAIDCW